MLEKNIFSLTLSCSIIGHFLWIQAVTIVWPPQLIRSKFAVINFWGPILESTSYAPARLAANGSLKERSEKEDLKFKQGDLKKINTHRLEKIEKVQLPLTELSQREPAPVEVNIPSPDKLLITEKITEKLQRSIIYKPELPTYSEWAKEFGNNFEIELKFLILPDGTVGNVEKITSSGYPELDEIGVRYIRKWKFMPLLEDALQEGQWGLIKLVFKLQ